MGTLLNAAYPSLAPPFRKTGAPQLQPFKPRLHFFFGWNEVPNGSLRAAPRAEFEDTGNQEASHETAVSSRTGLEFNDDIWKLFKEAQQNILHLNQQRLKAFEEMNKIKKEKEILLNRLEQLERENHTSIGKDRQSMCWELLLRIDSMVLRGFISSAESSEFRRLITESKLSIVDIFSILQKRSTELLAELRHFSANQNKTALHIVHICAEMEPLVSVGSLASYITGISRALQRKGNLVEVILPKYSCTNLDEIQGLHEIETELYSYFDGQLHENKIWTGVLRGVGVTLIQPLHYSSFFNRERVYGYADDFERFSYFSRASLDYIVKSGKQPDVLHIHNRETAIIGPLFWDIFVKQGLGSTRILLACQDLDSQFLEQPDKLALCGLEPSRLHRSDRLQDNTRTHLVNILKGGIVYSNKVIILSHVHSKEKIIRTLGNGLETTLAIYQDKLLAAPYGFDKSTWDPSTDKVLPECYSADNMEGKAVCKVTLQQHLGLPEHSSVPIVGCILSNVTAADLEHLREVVWMASRSCFQFIVMEHSEDAIMNRVMKSRQNAIKEENMRVIDHFDETLSHLVFAGSDIILCSSLLGPLLQLPLKAIKYGAAPIALTSTDNRFRRAIDVDFDGTKLSQYINSTYANLPLSQAIEELKENSVLWNRRIVEGMRKDFSWDGECSDIHISAYTSIKNL